MPSYKSIDNVDNNFDQSNDLGSVPSAHETALLRRNIIILFALLLACATFFTLAFSKKNLQPTITFLFEK